MVEGCSVYVGGIPPDATNDDVVQVLSRVGNVVSFSRKHDRLDGHPLNYGFCEFKTGAMATAARDNEFVCNGKRLQIGPASHDQPRPNRMDRRDRPMQMRDDRRDRGMYDNHGRGYDDMGDGGRDDMDSNALQAPVDVRETIDRLEEQDQYSMMVAMKTMMLTDPDGWRTLINSNPVLSYAVIELHRRLNAAPQEPTPETDETMRRITEMSRAEFDMLSFADKETVRELRANLGYEEW